jgi:hypothetical protein
MRERERRDCVFKDLPVMPVMEMDCSSDAQGPR